MKIYDVQISSIKHAILGMRASHQSYDKVVSNFENNTIGEADLKLILKLIKAGSSHRKFLRFINFSFVSEMPLYWWKQFDQYKVGVTILSESTMHNIMDRDLTSNDFETESPLIHTIIGCLNERINRYKYYKLTNDISYQKRMFNEIISLLPQSYIQKRYVNMNFEVMYSIIKDRSKHKLNEWQFFINNILESNKLFGILKEGV